MRIKDIDNSEFNAGDRSFIVLTSDIWFYGECHPQDIDCSTEDVCLCVRIDPYHEILASEIKEFTNLEGNLGNGIGLQIPKTTGNMKDGKTGTFVDALLHVAKQKPIDRALELRTELYNIANSYAGDETGDVAVMLHEACNCILRARNLLRRK